MKGLLFYTTLKEIHNFMKNSFLYTQTYINYTRREFFYVRTINIAN